MRRVGAGARVVLAAAAAVVAPFWVLVALLLAGSSESACVDSVEADLGVGLSIAGTLAALLALVGSLFLRQARPLAWPSILAFACLFLAWSAIFFTCG